MPSPASGLGEQFRKRGVQLRRLEALEIARSTSTSCRRSIPAKVELPDNPSLVNQFASLERRTSRAGRDVVDHPPGGRDDVANAVAGACLLAFDRAAPALWSAGTSLPEWHPVRHGIPVKCDMLVSLSPSIATVHCSYCTASATGWDRQSRISSSPMHSSPGLGAAPHHRHPAHPVGALRGVMAGAQDISR